MEDSSVAEDNEDERKEESYDGKDLHKKIQQSSKHVKWRKKIVLFQL